MTDLPHAPNYNLLFMTEEDSTVNINIKYLFIKEKYIP